MHHDFLVPNLLSRVEEFKSPDSWVHLGEHLNHPGDNNGRRLPIRLGIDFGTAFTKVAYNIADKVDFVEWSGVRKVADASDGYFLPGEMSTTEDESVVLGNCPTKISLLNNLKNPFLGDKLGACRIISCNGKELRLTPDRFDVPDFSPIVVFVAWIFRYTRAWIYKKHKAILAGRKIAYQVNFGMPSCDFSWKYENEYQKIVSSAWNLSQFNEKYFTLKTAGRLLEGNNTQNESGLDSLDLIPEFVAQIAGYIQSPQYRNDLHMFFDVGAGTIDVSLFSLYKKQTGYNYAILSSQVKPLGTCFLEIAKNKTAGDQSVSIDGFAKNVIAALRKTFYDGKNKCSELYKLAEKSGLPIFRSGGGVVDQLYQTASDIVNFAPEAKIKLLDMGDQIFDRVDLTGEELRKNSKRLSVAYGLTFDKDAIMSRLVTPDKISSDSNPPKVRTYDHNEIYSK